MAKSKYINKLAPLKGAPFFTAAEAEAEGVSRQELAFLAREGDLERVYLGTYRFSTYEPQVDFMWEDLALIAASTPNAVICLISALIYHDLSDQIMREMWIAIPNKSYSPKRPNTRVTRMRNTELGRITIQLGEYRVQIFDRERCVVDAFRLLSKEIAIKALQRYLSNREFKPNLHKLGEYAKKMRVDITPYVLAYTT